MIAQIWIGGAISAEWVVAVNAMGTQGWKPFDIDHKRSVLTYLRSSAVNQAIGKDPERPSSLDGLEERERRCETIAAETEKIKAYLAANALSL